MSETKGIKVKVETRHDGSSWYVANEVGGFRASAKIGPYMAEALGISLGDTIILSARKVEKLLVPIHFRPIGKRTIWICPKCKSDGFFCRPARCANCEQNFHPTRTIELADLLAGVETEVEL